MDCQTRRKIGYPIVGAILGGLIYGGFIYEAEPAYLTLVSAAQVHAQMAARLPADRADLAKVRQQELDKSRVWLERAEESDPTGVETVQLRAYLAMVEEDFDRAADLYQKAGTLNTCPDDVRPWMSMHQAKALSNAGRMDDALTALQTAPLSTDPVYTVKSKSLHARILMRVSRDEEAAKIAEALVARSESEARYAGGTLLEALGRYEAASAAYEKAESNTAVRDYHMARLKLRAGASEEAVELLRRSVEAGETRVTNLLRRDREFWGSCAEANELLTAEETSDRPAAPGAGR